MPEMHLAELNVGRFRFPTHDPRMAEFMDNLARVNALAERMPGLVWRMQDDSGNATGIEVTPQDPMMAANLSVWSDPKGFEHFVYNTVHRRFYENRAKWFEVLDSMHFAMWWVPAGTRPTLAEAMDRLAHLDRHGPTERAFGWAELRGATLWQSRGCANNAAA